MVEIIGVGVVAALLIWLQYVIYKRMWNRSLHVKIEFGQKKLLSGEKGQLYEVVENRKHLPLAMLKVKFQTDRNLVFDDMRGARVTDRFYRNDIFQIGGGEKITRTVHFTAKKRGYYRILGVDLVSTDLFFSSDFVDSRQVEGELYVYPKPFGNKEFMQSLQKLNGEVLTKRHLIEDPFEYRGIREYQPYDDMRSVNWKATARTDDLKVNQKNYTSIQTVRIFFNIEDSGIYKKEAEVETTLRFVASLAGFFLAEGVRVAVYGNGLDCISGDVCVIEAGAGAGQMDHINRILARIDTGVEAAPFVKHFGNQLLMQSKGLRTVIVAPNAYEDMLQLMQEYHDAQEEFTWFCPVIDAKTVEFPDWMLRDVELIPVREGE